MGFGFNSGFRCVRNAGIAVIAASFGVLAGCQVTPFGETASTVTALEAKMSVEQPGKKIKEEESPFAVLQVDYPDSDPVLGLVDSRSMTSLNGTWNMIIDPMGVGEPGGFFGGFTKNRRPETGMELIEYDFEKSPEVRVPGDFNTQDERLLFYQGRVWYYRTFEAEAAEGKRQHLWFGGANFATEVYLNGEPIGEHKGGYVPFSWDVTDKLQDGKNTLIVKVDNRLSADTVPTQRTDWWPYGGLTRDVAIIETPDAFIRNAKIELTDAGARTLKVSIETVGMPAGTQAVVELPELKVSQIVTIGSNGQGAAAFGAPVDLWSPDSPRLYDVTFSAGEDVMKDRVGFRTIETRGTQIVLNGEPIKLRGISTHEEPIGVKGVAYSYEQKIRLLTEAKVLNANFVRAAHYPYSRHMARAADEVGIMLWEEIPVYWNIAWENPETLAVARDQMARLVQRDWNRASVIIWSVANETPLSEARMTFLKLLIDDVREMDNSRLVSAALLGGGRKQFESIITHLAVRGLDKGGLDPKDEAIFKAIVAKAGDQAPGPHDTYTLMIDDPLGEFTDVVAYNQYFGWYYSVFFAQQSGVSEAVLRPLMLDMMRDIVIDSHVEKPVHISEFGAGARAGRKGGEALIWTEEYQAKVYEAQIAMIRNSPKIQGMTPWILKDFRAMLRTLPGVQDYYNRKGVIDENGNRKLAFGVLRDFYAGEWDSAAGQADTK